MKTKMIVTALVFAAALAAPAIAAPVCLLHRDVDGWGARDDKSMVVNDRFGRKYLVSLAGVCSDINWAFSAGFRTRFSGGCVERGERLILRGGGATFPHSTCWVTKVQPYTPEMQQADKLAKANKQPLNSY